MTVGLLVRRTLPAMATTLVGFVAVRVVTTLWVRPYLMPPQHLSLPLDEARMGFYRTSGSGPFGLHPEGPGPPERVGPLDDDRRRRRTTRCRRMRSRPSAPTCSFRCPAPGAARPLCRTNAKDTIRGCVSELSAQYHALVTYQPASRYWLFQALETGIFVALSLLLAGFCFWWVRRRVS